MMHRLFSFLPTFRGGQRTTTALAAVWCLGLLSGCRLFSQIRSTLLPWMRLAPTCRVSIVGLLAGNLLPFLLSYLVFRFSTPRLIYAVCFLRAARYGFCALGIGLGYGSAGWLIRSLLLFSDGLTMPALLWFWIRHLGGRRETLTRDVLLCGVLAGIAGVVEILWTAPFLAGLLSF